MGPGEGLPTGLALGTGSLRTPNRGEGVTVTRRPWTPSAGSQEWMRPRLGQELPYGSRWSLNLTPEALGDADGVLSRECLHSFAISGRLSAASGADTAFALGAGA